MDLLHRILCRGVILMAKELFLTNSVARRMLTLAPVLDAVPEIRAIGQELEAKKNQVRKSGCRGCGDRAAKYYAPVNLQSRVAEILPSLNEEQKNAVLDAFRVQALKGFAGSGSSRSVTLLSR